MVVNKARTVSTSFTRWWLFRGSEWAERERNTWLSMAGTDLTVSFDSNNVTATGTTSTTKMVLDEAVLYMRQISVAVSASNYTPSVDNIKCYFDDIQVPLTPTGTTLGGTIPGTVRADVTGRFTARFTIPPNTPCGSVEVRLESDLGQGSTIFSAQGRHQIMEQTVLRTTITARQVVNVDPLAQSFQFAQDTVLTRVGVYFATKDPNKAVVLQIRDMVNGYPGTTIYDTVVVPPESISTSVNGTTQTLINLNQPVYCIEGKEYCFAILSDSDVYSMFIATLGNKILGTNQFVTSQPYVAGVLFSSSNATTWTTHQSSDLKFTLYRARYTQEGTAVFNDVEDLDITGFLLAANTLDYKDDGIEWSFKVDNGLWTPVEPYVERSLAVVGNKVGLKVTVSPSANGYTTPFVASDAVNLIGLNSLSTGTYVSRNVVMDEAFTKIKVVMNVSVPSGTSFKVFYQNIDVGSSWTELTNPTVTPVDEEFSRYEFNKTGISATNYRVKITLTTTNPLIRPRVRKLINILKY